ncbi:hypothetical protein Tsubulata_049733 [Turnera subulata]|uniref:WRC domain-containing protein n=1 Tax=Turnera subulata TaxID=218843 RepID=A0A9Q0JBS8_9ROSI|nr:hypothetical protein Tsubulata_049733 [Turnera subulata]
MRIRKRQVPLPLSSLSPVPLSDPLLLSRSPPVVQLQLHTTTPNALHHLAQEADKLSYLLHDSPPSDRPNHPIAPPPGDNNKVLLEKKDERERSINDSGKGSSSFSGAERETLAPHQQPTISLSSQVGSWGEGETAFPLKKRRGLSLERKSGTEETILLEKDKKMMKTKMNKKSVAQDGNNALGNNIKEDNKESKEEGSVDGGGGTSGGGGGRKRGRGGGGALLEGSRCSRVNGRGWRCCQQTLVGYSLCEHHLGKGRLRSMNSVRSRSSTTKNTTTAPPKNIKPESHPIIPSSTSPSFEEKEEIRDVPSDVKVGGEAAGDYDHEKQQQQQQLFVMSPKKKMKLGMVKARSISSLLGQASDAIEVTDDNN